MTHDNHLLYDQHVNQDGLYYDGVTVSTIEEKHLLGSRNLVRCPHVHMCPLGGYRCQ